MQVIEQLMYYNLIMWDCNQRQLLLSSYYTIGKFGCYKVEWLVPS